MTDEIKQIIRVANTDIRGHIPLYHALTKIRGVSYSLANAICNSVNIEKLRKIGSLTEQELNKIESCIKDPIKHGMPYWLLNRQHDTETGKDLHLTGADLKFRVEQDIKTMKRLKTYRGIRHSIGQPVRGQRTKAHFRKGTTVGVQRSKKMMAPTKDDSKKEGKK
ncbi:30S ribosomal protein S13 [Candidatus Woesearchaeota archaeon]|nr:30S ribosomal protein S13 [Candidatus Woesearchaeota archaeon]